MAMKRVSGLDALSAGTGVWVLAGPVAAADDAGIVRGLQRLVDSDTDQRVGLVPDRASMCWFDEQTIDDRYLLSQKHIDASDPVLTLTQAMSEVPVLGVQADAAGHHLLVAFNHGIGDAKVMAEVVAELSRSDEESELAATPLQVATPRPLRLAHKAALRAAPGAFMTALACVGARLGREFVGGAYRRVAGARGSRPTEELAATKMTVCYVRSKPSFLGELAQWRAAHAPDTSTNSILFHRIWHGIREVGLDPIDEVELLVDLRRHLPKGADSYANLAAVSSVHIAADMTPVEFGSRVADEMVSLRPLIRAGLASLARNARNGTRLHQLCAPDMPVRPRLTISDISRAPGISKIAWRTDASKGADVQRTFAVALQPGSAERISLGLCTIDGIVHATATFSPDVVSPEAVERGVSLALNLGRW